MGEVYLGEKVGPEGFIKPVVLKCVLPQLAKDQAFVQLFLDEARLAALLNHPNIAQIYDFGIVDNVYYMAMEYVPGYTVDDIRRKHKSIGKFMPIEHIALIGAQAAQGLHYAHSLTDASNVSLGLVHRDASPHNLIVSVDGTVKIVDFGIAKARAGLTRVQAKGAVGKFGYMSPEQSRGETVDPRTDVFSLGICLWELTTNTRLHDAKLERAPDYRREVPPVSALRPDVPKQFDRLLQTALALHPEQRHSSAKEMYLEAERFLAAMTHYAGVAALAEYIKDLVDGRIENPDAITTGGGMVQPASHTAASAADKASAKLGMEAAQKYEEVFGVNLEASGQKEPQGLKAVPRSWEQKEKPPETARPAAPVAPMVVNAREIELPLDTGASSEKLELELDDRDHGAGYGDAYHPPSRHAPRPVGASPRPRPGGSARRPSRGLRPLTVLLVLLVLGLIGGGAFLLAGDRWKDALTALGLSPAAPKQAQAMTGDYHFETDPVGATIVLDGSKQEGLTPQTLSLIPGVEHQLEFRLHEHATRRMSFKADAHPGVKTERIRLEAASTLRIETAPSGAKIYLEGFEVKGARTPATFSDVPGGRAFRVEVELQGKPKLTRDVTITPGGSEKVVFEFPRR